MSLFDTIFGFNRKPEPQPVGFSTWEDTVPPTQDEKTEVLAPHAAWPFPTAEAHPELTPPADVEAKLTVNTSKLASYHAELAARRRADKAELKEIVQAAPEHGIEFVHVGTTTFAWRYHDNDEGYARNKRVIDISTAVCNPADQFAKWQGSAIAARNMLDGKYITLRVGLNYASPREAVQFMGTATLPISDAIDHVSNLFRD